MKTRLKRGLATLRTRLERERGTAWCLAFVTDLRLRPSSAGATPFSLAKGILAMSISKKLAAAAIVLAGLAAWLALPLSPTSRATTPIVASEPDAAAAVSAHALDAHVESERSLAAISPALAAQAPASATPTPHVGALEVRVVSGFWKTAVAGIGVVVHAAADERPALFGARHAIADEHGVARLEGLEPGELRVATDRGHWTQVTVRAEERVACELWLRETRDVRGRVVSAEGEPVADAEIWRLVRDGPPAEVPLARSDAHGAFEIRGLHLASEWLVARHPAHAASTAELDIGQPARVAEIELRLRGTPASAAGVVRGPRGEPIEGAWVDAAALRGMELARVPWVNARRDVIGTRTNAAGRYELNGLLPVPSWIRVRAPGLRARLEAIDLVAGESTARDLDMTAGASLAGIVRRADGSAAARAVVHVRVIDEKRGHVAFESTSARTDDEGRYRIDGLEPGAVRATAELGRDAHAESDIALVDSTTVVWTPTLAILGVIAGIVLDEHGEPATDVQVHARASGLHDQRAVRGTAVDDRGAFRLEGCRDGEHVLTAHATNGSSFAIARAVVARAGETGVVLRVDGTLRPSAWIHGRVLDPDGQPVRTFDVTPWSDDDQVAHKITADDGTFRIGPFPPGSRGLRVEADGFATANLAQRELAAHETWDCGTVALARGRAIRMSLVHPPGARAAPSIFVERVDGPGYEWCTVEGARAFSPPLAPGRYRVVVEGGYVAPRTILSLGAERDTEIELRLERGVAFSIRLNGRARDTLARTTVTVRDAHGDAVDERSPPRESAEPFTYSVCLAPGRYSIDARDSTGRWAQVDVDVAEALTNLTVDVALR